MTVGLLLTAFCCSVFASSATLIEMIFTNKIFFFGLIIAQLALVFILSGMVHKMEVNGALATTLFYALFALTGVTISSVLIVYTYSSVASTFFICAAMFGLH